MKNKRYATYSNSGGIQKVISGESLTYHETLTDIFNEWNNREYVKGEVNLQHYSFDERINKDVFILKGSLGGHKNHFLCFVIEIQGKGAL